MIEFERDDLKELKARGFDPDGFEKVWKDHESGRWDRELIPDVSRIAPPREEHLFRLPPPGSPARRDLEVAGRDAIDSGRVGAVVLNGGMATRFGGGVKGTVEVVGGRSFLDLKISQIRAVSSRVPIFLMNSPATHEATLRHLEGIPAAGSGVHTFLQPVGPRVSGDGTLVREDGVISTSGMGHGDALTAFRDGGLELLRGLGGEIVTVSNVDNLGACLDPVIIGAHLAGGRRVSVEVAPRDPADKGGMPVLLDGRAVLLEGFRWPDGLDARQYATFNTNTFVIDAEVFEDPPVLDAYPVRKKVGNVPVVQFERILGEVTLHEPSCFVVVPVEGAESRFIPIKTRDDLERRRRDIAACLGRWSVL